MAKFKKKFYRKKDKSRSFIITIMSKDNDLIVRLWNEGKSIKGICKDGYLIDYCRIKNKNPG